MADTVHIGILLFPDVTQLDATGPAQDGILMAGPAGVGVEPGSQAFTRAKVAIEERLALEPQLTVGAGERLARSTGHAHIVDAGLVVDLGEGVAVAQQAGTLGGVGAEAVQEPGHQRLLVGVEVVPAVA